MPRSNAPLRRAVAPLPLLAALALAGGSSALAQPGSFFGGRLRLAGEASGTIAPEDEGYFNYSDYRNSSLRLLRLDLVGEVRLASFAAILADVRSDNLGAPRLYACYLRLSPWPGRAVDVQAGLVPPVFGAFARRRYASDNPLPSLPLAYQYLTDLRYDAIPASAEQLVAQRARGWQLAYPIGSPVPAPGLPLIDGERWDTGVELRVGREPLSLSAALTRGSLSHPTREDDNDGKQISARLAWTARPALSLGLSGALGEFLSRSVTAALPEAARGRGRQRAVGFDLEWSRGYWLLRAEALVSLWTLPALEATPIEDPLTARAFFVEARYKLRPGLYAAGRVERLSFGSLDSSLGRRTWDAPVTRVEAGAGYAPVRYVLLKASWQHNARDGGRVRRNSLAAAQLVLWF